MRTSLMMMKGLPYSSKARDMNAPVHTTPSDAQSARGPRDRDRRAEEPSAEQSRSGVKGRLQRAREQSDGSAPRPSPPAAAAAHAAHARRGECSDLPLAFGPRLRALQRQADDKKKGGGDKLRPLIFSAYTKIMYEYF